MPVAASWKCIYCGTVYASQDDAVTCERTHHRFFQQDLKYRKGERYPHKIVVTFVEDSEYSYPKEVTYVRE